MTQELKYRTQIVDLTSDGFLKRSLHSLFIADFLFNLKVLKNYFILFFEPWKINFVVFFKLLLGPVEIQFLGDYCIFNLEESKYIINLKDKSIMEFIWFNNKWQFLKNSKLNPMSEFSSHNYSFNYNEIIKIAKIHLIS